MANTVTSSKYLVFSSGYEGRLLNPEFADQLKQFCTQKEITPIAIMQPNARKITSLHIIDDNVITGSDDMTVDEGIEFRKLFDTLKYHNLLSRECIIFRVESFNTITDIIARFKNIKHCEMHDEPVIDSFFDKNGAIDLIYVTIEVE